MEANDQEFSSRKMLGGTEVFAAARTKKGIGDVLLNAENVRFAESISATGGACGHGRTGRLRRSEGERGIQDREVDARGVGGRPILDGCEGCVHGAAGSGILWPRSRVHRSGVVMAARSGIARIDCGEIAESVILSGRVSQHGQATQESSGNRKPQREGNDKRRPQDRNGAHDSGALSLARVS